MSEIPAGLYVPCANDPSLECVENCPTRHARYRLMVLMAMKQNTPIQQYSEKLRAGARMPEARFSIGLTWPLRKKALSIINSTCKRDETNFS